MKLHRTICAAAVAILGFAVPATAQAPTTVTSLLAEGYEIITSFPIEGGYGVLLHGPRRAVVLCQITFNAADQAFRTDRCYPVD